MKITSSAGSSGSFRLASVGSKLAGAIVLLMILVTAGIFLGLSRYQRENLLRAKETAALALARLFSDSCVAAVVFDDDSAVRDALVTLGRNPEVEYAAVWKVDDGGNLGQRVAELARGRAEIVVRVPAAMVSQRSANRLVVVSPVRDQGNKVVAVAAIALSLTSENRAIAEVEHRTLTVSSGVALGVTLLLMAMARLLIVRPLGKLVLAAKGLEDGQTVELDVESRDEVGQLAAAFRSMAQAIAIREERIKARNRDMRLVLDNAGQGFITLDANGNMSQERSRIVDEWFGEAGGSLKFWDYLAHVNPRVADWFSLGWDELLADVLPLEVCLDQLPKTVSAGARTWELAYRPIVNGERLDKLIVVVTDVTARVERDLAEQAHREMMNVFRRILADRFAFDEFFDEASALVAGVATWDGRDLGLLKRQIHTLKGNCASFEIESVASFCHELEDRIASSVDPVGEREKDTLRALWAKIDETRSQLTHDGAGRRIELERDEYADFLSDLQRRAPHELLTATAYSWQFEPAATRLALLSEQLRRAAAKLGKAPLEVICRPTTLRLPGREWTTFWSVFAHVIRNTADHGVQTAEERQRAGKSQHATVTLGIGREERHLVLIVEDDGPGIDWGAIAERARICELPCATRRDLEEALFAPGFSSRGSVTTTSGRGVGLTVVRETVRTLGGSIEIQSKFGQGTTFRFLLPLSMLHQGPGCSSANASGSEQDQLVFVHDRNFA